jgi:hypothetical protein
MRPVSAPAVAVQRASANRRSSFAITSIRGVDEWLDRLDDPILGTAALNRVANVVRRIVIEGRAIAPGCHPSERTSPRTGTTLFHFT